MNPTSLLQCPLILLFAKVKLLAHVYNWAPVVLAAGVIYILQEKILQKPIGEVHKVVSGTVEEAKKRVIDQVSQAKAKSPDASEDKTSEESKAEGK